MNIAFMTVSLPIDEETFQEIQQLSQFVKEIDRCAYAKALNLSLLKKAFSRGFCILAYDENTNALVACITAVDKIGLDTYEWSMLVDPMYRDAGIDETFLSLLSKAFKERRAMGELVALHANDLYGRKILKKYGYTYSFSESTFEAEAEMAEMHHSAYIRPFNELTDLEPLIEIYREAFGDLREESLELIALNKNGPGRVIWVAEMDGEVAGTITTVQEELNQWITSLAVHPRHRRKGIANALLHWAKDFAYRSSIKRVLLDVEMENEEALSVYQKAGFHMSNQLDFYVYGEY
ncbi:GNAT family N-acetyltransferase [Ureibacillus terrenus]|uniref:GNAT family N-acetyltransferase n=1 Tax=Ureibacillus terrenus TaxID=118246 RepID=A0A540V5B3_9BACL|nr:GNAT family N-acetyltransferase [Ureibacillus terrenus]TQE91947.1 GNAT family N-acetyltransferase [Ureibacillus terrenus]